MPSAKAAAPLPAKVSTKPLSAVMRRIRLLPKSAT
jgi:hypothetical protein